MRSLGEKSDPKLAGPALEHFALDNVLIIRFFVGLAHGVAQTPMRRANPCGRFPGVMRKATTWPENLAIMILDEPDSEVR